MNTLTIRKISNGFIVTLPLVPGAPPVTGSNEQFVATLEELTTLVTSTFTPAE